jgi:hypothetical protein
VNILAKVRGQLSWDGNILNGWEAFLEQWDMLTREATARYDSRQLLMQEIDSMAPGSLPAQWSEVLPRAMYSNVTRFEIDHERFKQRVRDFCLGNP